jgi:hypothetical protein
MKPSVPILLLVALLLPFKGAMAAMGVLCHTTSAPPAVAAPAPTGHDCAHDGAGDAAPEQVPSCSVCASICAAPSLPATPVVLHGMDRAAGERFPALATPRARFAAGGLERPPRSI